VLLEKGPGYIAELVKGLGEWMAAHEYESVEQMRGSLSQRNVAEPAAFERANYMKVLGSWQ
jgi:dihydroorotate dehydrogenase (fumarate)